MGKSIDRIVLTALLAASLYLLFVQAFRSVWLACALSFACSAMILRRVLRAPRRARMTTAQASALLERWAYGPDDEAETRIAKLLDHGEDCALVYLPRHPAAAVSMGDVFSAWKAHRRENRLILAAPCRADGRAKTFARTLQDPSVEIADAPQLVALIRRSGLEPPHVPRFSAWLAKLRLAVCALPERRPWKQSALYGLLLIPVYLLTSNPAYLFLGLASLFLAGISLRLHRG